MSQRRIAGRGVTICAESFGRAGDPPVLLVMGALSSAGWWPDGLVERLAAAGRFVIRYDHRDTGQSGGCPPGAPDYVLDDLADDALAVLDGYGIGRAHVVGMSLGGLLGQILALRDPGRVASLTLIASELHGDPGFEPRPIDPAILALFGTAGAVDWSDPAAGAAFMVELWRLCTGPGRRFDADQVREVALREMRRARSPASMFNHAQLGGGQEWADRTRELRPPMLVIHGRDDPVVDWRHGQALAARVPGARLVTLEGAGHELHPDDWGVIVAEIVALTG